MPDLRHLLSNARVDIAETEILLAAAIGRPKEFVLAHPEYRPNVWERSRFARFARRRARGEPVAYILGHKEFFGLDFLINRHTLVPRPETEVLVEAAIEEIQNTCIAHTAAVDIGTGSGCIAVTLAKKIPGLNIFASDISAGALRVARKNARAHGVKINFGRGRLLLPFLQYIVRSQTIPRSIVIVANLPYGWNAWKNESSAETRGLAFEPKSALFTGKMGLQLYEELLLQIRDLIRRVSVRVTALIEFDPRQTELLRNLVKEIFPNAKIDIKKDLAARDRVAVIRVNC